MRLFPSLKRSPTPPPPGSPSRVLVACPDHIAPAGGVRQLYRLVDSLRHELGLDAFVYHRKTGFRLTWFQTDTPVLYADNTAPSATDTLILPEVFGGDLRHHLGIRKIIFNQNAYYTFNHGYTLPPSPALLRPQDNGVIGILTVSEDSANLLRYTFPGLPVERLCYTINPLVFYPGEKRNLSLAYMPRKNSTDLQQVLNILALRGSLDGIELVPIDGKNENETAALLRSSLVFLSFGYPEGFSLPPAEAMACGCLTIGYHGMGAREFMLPEFSWPIATGDILGYVKTIESVLAAWRTHPEKMRARAQAASSFIHRVYSPDTHRSSLHFAWSRFTAISIQP